MAQTAKVRRLDEAGVKSGSRVLKIGCGWGAGRTGVHYGAQVVGVTLSAGQLAWDQARLQKLGIDHGRRCAAVLRLQDCDIGDAAVRRHLLHPRWSKPWARPTGPQYVPMPCAACSEPADAPASEHRHPRRLV